MKAKMDRFKTAQLQKNDIKKALSIIQIRSSQSQLIVTIDCVTMYSIRSL